MKKFIKFSGIIFLMILFSTKIFGDNQFEDSMSVAFSDPSRPGLVKVVYGKGDVTIHGYDGKEVIIKTKSEIETLVNPPEDEKARGLKRISGTTFHVATIEDENAIVISRSIKDNIDLYIQVPFKTSLQLGGDNFERTSLQLGGDNFKRLAIKNDSGDVNVLLTRIKSVSSYMGGILEGDIEIKNVSGEMEISTLKGDINLLEISGEVTANTVDGDLLVTFEDVDRKKPMYFSTVDGDIDVTFPPDIQATLTLKSVDGDMYTDFDMDIVKKPEVEKKQDSTGSSNLFIGPKIRNFYFSGIGNNISANVNGGGPEIQMTTVNGNIYIRKRK